MAVDCIPAACRRRLGGAAVAASSHQSATGAVLHSRPTRHEKGWAEVDYDGFAAGRRCPRGHRFTGHSRSAAADTVSHARRSRLGRDRDKRSRCNDSYSRAYIHAYSVAKRYASGSPAGHRADSNPRRHTCRGGGDGRARSSGHGDGRERPSCRPRDDVPAGTTRRLRLLHVQRLGERGRKDLRLVQGRRVLAQVQRY